MKANIYIYIYKRMITIKKKLYLKAKQQVIYLFNKFIY